MKMLKVVLIGMIVLAISACSSINVNSDYDPQINFSEYKSYAWYEGEIPGDNLVNDGLTKKRIIHSIDGVLKSKGYNIVDEKEADFVVVIHAGVKEKTQIHTSGYGWYNPWYHPYYGPHHRDVYVSNYEEGTLVIDILDKEKEEVIWRGTGTKILKSYNSPEEKQEMIDYAVSEILKQFPPK